MKPFAHKLFAFFLIASLAACAPQTSPATGTALTATPTTVVTASAAPSATPSAVMTPDVSYGTSPGDATATAPSAEATVVPGPDSTEIITLDNNNSTLTLRQGQRFLLKLGEIYDWNLIIADQSVVSRVKNVLVVRGAQGLFEGLSAGQTDISAQGDPLCRSQKPACAMPSRIFHLTVIVE